VGSQMCRITDLADVYVKVCLCFLNRIFSLSKKQSSFLSDTSKDPAKYPVELQLPLTCLFSSRY